MIDTLENGHHALYHHAKFGEIKLRAPARCENMAFFVCHAWSACAWGTYFEQVLCHGLWVDFDGVFIVFLEEIIAL